MCNLTVAIKGSSAVNGTMIRGSTNEVIALQPVLDYPDCYNILGVELEWTGVEASTGKEIAALEDAKGSLTARIPAYSLGTLGVYDIGVRAYMRGSAEVASASKTRVQVPRQSLVARVKGGGVLASEGVEVLLDCSDSYNPNAGNADSAEAGQLTYTWNCSMLNKTEGEESASPCLDMDGGPLDLTGWHNTTLPLRLQGDPQEDGRQYQFVCGVSCEDLNASAVTEVAVVAAKRPLPLPTISVHHTGTGPAPTKASPNSTFTLVSEVQSFAEEETITLQWSATDDETSLPLNYSAGQLLSNLNSSNLVVKPRRVYLLHLPPSSSAHTCSPEALWLGPVMMVECRCAGERSCKLVMWHPVGSRGSRQLVWKVAVEAGAL
ncbi:hypothetical protein CYMTET_32583, partial [Cymbomonas tetramitiformis]